MRESRFHVQGGQRSNLYHLVIIEEEQDNTQLAENDENEDTVKHDIAASNTKHSSIEFHDPITIDLPAINFEELLEECVSRSPCHDGTP